MPRRRHRISPDRFDLDDDFDDDQKHPQRNAANARERARMRVLSKAFCRLKTTLPWVPADTKLSKLDTLRLATSYIAHLRGVLMDQPVQEENVHKHPLTLTWPFSFQRVPESPCTTDGTRHRDDSTPPPPSNPTWIDVSTTGFQTLCQQEQQHHHLHGHLAHHQQLNHHQHHHQQDRTRTFARGKDVSYYY